MRMRHIQRITGSFALFSLLAMLSAALVSAAEPKPIFDGKSLAKWEFDPAHWRVEDNAIVGQIPPGQSLNHNTWMIWRGGDIKDFDLRLQVRLTGKPAANSGIQIRCQAKGPGEVSGYQADLDMGATWLGRIYDEHGRALITERGTRVLIAEDGSRSTETFSPPNLFATLFRENDWNDYRIVGIGNRITVIINGTLFADLVDKQDGQCDLSGQLALQLHSGPETKVEFRDITLEALGPCSDNTRQALTPLESEALSALLDWVGADSQAESRETRDRSNPSA